MNKISELLNKYFIYAIWSFLFISLIVNFRSCGVSSDNRKMKQEIMTVQQEMDCLENRINSNLYSKEELDIRMEILSYEISKRMLYDQNSIVRSVTRPDDRMNFYDLKIQELRKKLKE